MFVYVAVFVYTFPERFLCGSVLHVYALCILFGIVYVLVICSVCVLHVFCMVSRLCSVLFCIFFFFLIKCRISIFAFPLIDVRYMFR